MTLYLYHIWQNVNHGWDTYDSAVVCAESEEEAKHTHPSTYSELEWSESSEAWTYKGRSFLSSGDWCDPKFVEVELIGTASEHMQKGVVVASFNAG